MRACAWWPQCDRKRAAAAAASGADKRPGKHVCGAMPTPMSWLLWKSQEQRRHVLSSSAPHTPGKSRRSNAGTARPEQEWKVGRRALLQWLRESGCCVVARICMHMPPDADCAERRTCTLAVVSHADPLHPGPILLVQRAEKLPAARLLLWSGSDLARGGRMRCRPVLDGC